MIKYSYKFGKQTIETLDLDDIPIGVEYETFDFIPPVEIDEELENKIRFIKNECKSILETNFRRTLERCIRKGVIFANDAEWVAYGEQLALGASGELTEIPEPPKNETGEIRYPEGS